MKSSLAIFSLLALCAGLALAQSGEEPATGDRGSAASASLPRSGDTAQAASDKQTDASADAAAPDTSAEEPVAEAPQPGDNSPFDYQASEQISEDLSVSFPIDI